MAHNYTQYERNFYEKEKDSLFEKAKKFQNSDRYTVFVNVYDEECK